jgi:hypothetical protein
MGGLTKRMPTLRRRFVLRRQNVIGRSYCTWSEYADVADL